MLLLETFQVSPQKKSTHRCFKNRLGNQKNAYFHSKHTSVWVAHLMASRWRDGMLLEVSALEQRAVGKRLQQSVVFLFDSLPRTKSISPQ